MENLERDSEEEFLELTELHESPFRKNQRKNKALKDQFLGRGKRATVSGILPRYYGDLLTWALQQYLVRNEWQICDTLGYRNPQPTYASVDTGNGSVNLLADGLLLIEKETERRMIIVVIEPRYRGSIQIEGPADKVEELKEFIAGVLTIAENENFYRGRRIEFSGHIRFLAVNERSWESIALDDSTREDIRANTVEFLRRREEWNAFNIPLKRGVLLAGEPGTGKTIICRALMTEAHKFTCITTSAYALDADDYFNELYELAQDLKPSMVFIEDIDMIAQDRMEFGYSRGPALLSLLNVMDGIEEQSDVVTIATTNCLERLDKAINERPSRFDRVVKINRPSFEHRMQLLDGLCQTIPLSKNLREYIAHKTEVCTPAQLQEIIFSLVIREPTCNEISTAMVDKVIEIVISKPNRFGFVLARNNNGKHSNISKQ